RKDRKPIDYTAFDSIGFDGIKPSVSPRAGSEGLPSPKDTATRSVEKRKPSEIDQFALLLQMNEKLERMVLENKRDYNKSKCQHPKDHYRMIKGVQKWVQHICTKCWTASKKIERHSEYSTDCPLFVADVAGSSSPANSMLPKPTHSG
ncbi:hypothetical protein QZH41_004434, partial [Actinostola sp. cb2023]